MLFFADIEAPATYHQQFSGGPEDVRRFAINRQCRDRFGTPDLNMSVLARYTSFPLCQRLFERSSSKSSYRIRFVPSRGELRSAMNNHLECEHKRSWSERHCRMGLNHAGYVGFEEIHWGSSIRWRERVQPESLNETERPSSDPSTLIMYSPCSDDIRRKTRKIEIDQIECN